MVTSVVQCAISGASSRRQPEPRRNSLVERWSACHQIRPSPVAASSAGQQHPGGQRPAGGLHASRTARRRAGASALATPRSTGVRFTVPRGRSPLRASASRPGRRSLLRLPAASPATARGRAPPRRARWRRARRTTTRSTSTDQPRWSARPAQTPPTQAALSGRVERGCSSRRPALGRVPGRTAAGSTAFVVGACRSSRRLMSSRVPPVGWPHELRGLRHATGEDLDQHLRRHPRVLAPQGWSSS